MQHFYHGIGEDWFSYAGLYSQMVENSSDGAHFVEAGVWRGRSACYMAVEIVNSGKNIKFDAVDTWEGSAEHLGHPLLENDGLYQEFIKNIEPVKDIINPIRKPSLAAANDYADRSLDYVFIDASHTYEDVIADLTAWYPKIKVGGIIAGHDYGSWESVTRAVDDFFNSINRGFIYTEELCFIHKKKLS
jgi:predicted O-methyltransferase YrrM